LGLSLITDRAPTRERSFLQRISSNVVWALAAEGIGKGAAFLVMIQLARTLGAESFGVFTFVYTLFTFLWVGVDLGLAMYGTREIARRSQDHSALVSAIIMMRLILAMLIALGTLTVGLIWLREPASKYLAVSFSLFLLFRACYLDWYLRGIEQYAALTLVSALVALGLLATAYLGIHSVTDLGKAGLPWVCGYALGALAIIAVAQRGGLRISLQTRGNWHIWMSHWRESIHFTLSNGVSLLYQNLPLFYLYAFAGPSVTGQFAAAFRAIIAAIFVFSIFPMAIYPVLADLYVRGEKRFAELARRSATLIGLGSVLVAAVVGIWAENIIDLIFGSDYSESALALRILLLFLVLRSVRAVYVRAVAAAGFQRDYSKIAIVSVVAFALLLGLITLIGLPPLLYSCWALVFVEAGILAAMWLLNTRIVLARFD
jgi:O-antigen/teichoic acid export membrane protein